MELSRWTAIAVATWIFAPWQIATAASPLAADFDGDGYTDVGLWDAVRVRALLDSTHDGRIDGITPALGVSSDVPFFGDWDGDGVETLAIYRRSSNQVIWTNSNSSSDTAYQVRSVVALSGSQGIAIRGDWNGDGVDGFAIYDVATRNFDFYQSMAGARFSNADAGNVGDIPISGDWNNDGQDGYAVYRPSTHEFWLYDALAAPPTLFIPSVGNPGDQPISGKWPGQSNWSIGLFRPSTGQFFLYSNLSLSGVQSVTWLDPTSVVPTAGRQSVYAAGVPHASVAGTTRTTYDASDSFLLLGIYGIWDTVNELGGNIFAELQTAGFNAAQIWPTTTVAEALTGANGTNIRLIPRFSPSDVAQYDGNQRIFGWYVWDEPSGAATYGALLDIYGTHSSSTSHFLFHAMTPPNQDPLWPSIASLGDAGAVDDYPIHTPALGTLSLESIASSVTSLRNARPATTPVWFVPQAFASNNPGDSWDMPATSPDQYRAMVYAAFVHGASGLLTFARDGWLMRSAGNLGISPHPQESYSTPERPCQHADGTDCLTPSSAALLKAQDLWNAVAHVNAELGTMRSAWLSPTSLDLYTIDLLQVPNSGTSPIRTLLKTSPNGTYLIAVNLINDNLDAVIQLRTPTTSVDVQFESRSIATPLGAIRDRFGPFAVHIYKF